MTACQHQSPIPTSWHWLPRVAKELLPPNYGVPEEIIPMGRRRRETAKIPVQRRKAMASPQAGWLHPALGCQLHHPWAARAGRWSPSSKLYFPVSENLCGRRGEKKAKETFWQVHKGAVLLQNLVAMEKISL